MLPRMAVFVKALKYRKTTRMAARFAHYDRKFHAFNGFCEDSPSGMQLRQPVPGTAIQTCGGCLMFRNILPAVLLVGIATTLSAQSNLSFELSDQIYQSPTYTYLVGQGDFNDDGKPDLITTLNGSNASFALMLGNGDGTFQAAKTGAASGGSIEDIKVADLNRDGKLDVAATLGVQVSYDEFIGELAVFYGNGDGTFQSPVINAVGGGGSLAIGNFFGNGYLDIAVQDHSSVEFFRNEGGKTFVSTETIPVTNSQELVAKIAAGNVDGKRESDIAVLTQKTAYVLWNDGHGNFTKEQLASYVNPRALTVGRMAQDGRADILVSYTCNPTLRTIRGMARNIIPAPE